MSATSGARPCRMRAPSPGSYDWRLPLVRLEATTRRWAWAVAAGATGAAGAVGVGAALQVARQSAFLAVQVDGVFSASSWQACTGPEPGSLGWQALAIASQSASVVSVLVSSSLQAGVASRRRPRRKRGAVRAR